MKRIFRLIILVYLVWLLQEPIFVSRTPPLFEKKRAAFFQTCHLNRIHVVERGYLKFMWAGVSGYDVIGDMTSLSAFLWSLYGGGGGGGVTTAPI